MDLVNDSTSDITDLNHAALAFESHEGVVITNKDGIIIQVNKSFTRITGYEANEVIGYSPSILSSGKHDKEFYTHMWHVVNTTGFYQGEICNRRKNGTYYTERISISAITNSIGKICNYFASFSDITDYKEALAEVHKLAHFDELTGLANRRLLTERVELAIIRGACNNTCFAILLLDLDGFKAVNDTHGHIVGDEVLQHVANRLLTRVRANDLVVRLGSDEFVILLEDIKVPEDAVGVASELITSISTTFRLDKGINVVIGVSIGISLYPTHTDQITDLIDCADMAMYISKKSGGKCFSIYEKHYFYS